MYILHSCVDSFLLFRATSCQFHGIYSFPDCHRDTKEAVHKEGNTIELRIIETSNLLGESLGTYGKSIPKPVHPFVRVIAGGEVFTTASHPKPNARFDQPFKIHLPPENPVLRVEVHDSNNKQGKTYALSVKQI
jgi:hypothetical protein